MKTVFTGSELKALYDIVTQDIEFSQPCEDELADVEYTRFLAYRASAYQKLREAVVEIDA